jgi:hypothetical protein
MSRRFKSNMRARFTMSFVVATIGRRFLETISLADDSREIGSSLRGRRSLPFTVQSHSFVDLHHRRQEQKGANTLVVMADDIGIWNIGALSPRHDGSTNAEHRPHRAVRGALHRLLRATVVYRRSGVFITGQHPFRTGLLAAQTVGLGIDRATGRSRRSPDPHSTTSLGLLITGLESQQFFG